MDSYTYLALAELSGIRAGQGIENNGTFEAGKKTRLRLGYLRVGELQRWHILPPCIALKLTIQFKLYLGIRAWSLI